jgi:DNA polymerase-3 subunit epsilon
MGASPPPEEQDAGQSRRGIHTDLTDTICPTGAATILANMLERLIALERPVVFFDTETTGTNPRMDRIVEIACVKVHPDGRRESFVRRLDPGMPIPRAATAIHGISDSDVAGEPTFADVADELTRFFDGCDLAGYNVAGFDLPVLRVEFLRVGREFDVSSRRMIDAQRIFFAHEPRHLSAAARLYCGRDHAGAHGALADAEMSLDVFVGQLERYGDLPRSVEQLHELYCAGLDRDLDPEGKIRLVSGEPTVNFGRYRGRTLREMGREDPSFLEWILQEDFSRPVKEIVRTFLPAQTTLFT